MSKTFKTPKGTELPILNLRGKDYLQVMHRLVWFREDRPTWGIETEFVTVTDNSSFCRATIKDDNGRIVAQSHKTETAQGFPDFIEKSETGAIGRALALIGYGTQFCADELDEGERLADSPSAPRSQPKPSSPLKAVSAPANSEEPGSYVISFGERYKGKRLDHINQDELSDWVHYLKSKAKEKNKPLDGVALEAVNEAERWLDFVNRPAGVSK